MNQEMLASLENEINKVVDNWVSETLKDRLIKGTEAPQRRSLWDRLKQGVMNWWYGPQGDKDNPYRWKNRFGHSLGSEEVKESSESVLFTLGEYSEIKAVVDSVEDAFNENQDSFMDLKLMRILTGAAAELKVKLFDTIKSKLATVQHAPREVSPKAPETAVRAEPEATHQKAPEPISLSGRIPTSRMSSSKANKTEPIRSSEVLSKSDHKEKETTQSTKIDTAKENEKKDNEDSENENEELSAYLQDDKSGKRYELGDSVKNITGFLKSVQEFIKNPELKRWWLEKQQDYISKSEKSGIDEVFLQMWNELVKTDLIVREIEKITGVAKAKVKKMMLQYIEDKKARSVY